MNRKLRIVKLPRDQKRPGGLGQFPWNTYYSVNEGDRPLAIVSTCNVIDKGVCIEGGQLSRAEHLAVARALKVGAPNFLGDETPITTRRPIDRTDADVFKDTLRDMIRGT